MVPLAFQGATGRVWGVDVNWERVDMGGVPIGIEVFFFLGRASRQAGN